MMYWIIGLSSFAGLLLGLIFGWDAREFVMRHTSKDLLPEQVPDIVPTDRDNKGERF